MLIIYFLVLLSGFVFCHEDRKALRGTKFFLINFLCAALSLCAFVAIFSPLRRKSTKGHKVRFVYWQIFKSILYNFLCAALSLCAFVAIPKL